MNYLMLRKSWFLMMMTALFGPTSLNKLAAEVELVVLAIGTLTDLLVILHYS
jgi:hypothetical protein